MIQPKWKSALERCVEEVRRYIGSQLHSIYVRGSVAMGTAVEGYSDIDLIVVADVSADELETLKTDARAWQAALSQTLRTTFPFIYCVDLSVRRLEHLGEIMERLIKLWSVCLYGTNLAPSLPNYRPEDLGHLHRDSLAKSLEKARTQLLEPTEQWDERDLCRWVMKRIIRHGFSLDAVRRRCYTRDLYPAYREFSAVYPEKEGEMYQVLELAINPTADKDEILAVMESLGRWVARQQQASNGD